MAASKGQQIAGWILSGLIAAFLMFSVSGKFMDWPGKEEMFQKMGHTIDGVKVIGVVEAIIAVLYLIPQTAFLGAILLTGYLGGATELHVRLGDPFYFPIVLGVLAWIGYALRRPDVIKSAFGRG